MEIAGIVVLSLAAGFFLLCNLLILRYALRLAVRANTEAVEWRHAATNATILARVYEVMKNKAEQSDGEESLHGG